MNDARPVKEAPRSRLARAVGRGGARREGLELSLVLALVLALGASACSRSTAPAPTATADVADSIAPPKPKAVALVAVGESRAGSSVVLAELGERLIAYVADEDDEAVHVIDLRRQTEIGSLRLGSRPGQMIVTRDGKLLVALRDAAQIAVLDATVDPRSPLVMAGTVPTAPEPIALAVTPNGDGLVVATGFSATVEGFRIPGHDRTFSVGVAREPRAVVVSSDGSKAFVAHAASGDLTVVDLVKPSQASATRVDLGRAGAAPLTSRHGYALATVSGAEERLFAPHVLVDPGPSSTVTVGYGSGGAAAESFAVAMLDVRGERIAQARSARFVDPRGTTATCLLPRAVVTDAARGSAYVACLGADIVVELPLAEDASDAMRTTPTRQFKVPSGPVGLALHARRGELVVWSQFDRSLAIVELATGERAPRTIALTRGHALPAQLAEGRKLFHAAGDRRIARDGRACASCHPDGRDDGLVWSSPEGPRQTIFLAGRTDKGPFGWRGEHASIPEHLVNTVKNLNGTGLSGTEREAVAAYVQSLRAPPDAKRVADPKIARGREIFASDEAACASCHHTRDGFSDRDVHDVQSAASVDKWKEFRTPSLRAISGSAPYFHDGRYATLGELLRKSGDNMGSTAHLTDADRDALEAYLRTL